MDYVVKAIDTVIRNSQEDDWKNEKAEKAADPTVGSAGRSAVPAGKDVIVDVMMNVASGVRNGVDYFAVKA